MQSTGRAGSIADMAASPGASRSSSSAFPDEFNTAVNMSTISTPQKRANGTSHFPPRKRLRAEDLWDEDTVSVDLESGTAAPAVLNPPRFTAAQRAIRRQEDSSLDDQDYEELRNFRRRENPDGVDRYVPDYEDHLLQRTTCGQEGPQSATSLPLRLVDSAEQREKMEYQPTHNIARGRRLSLLDLPNDALEIIISLVLVREEQITVDYSWLISSLLVDKSNIPPTTRTITIDGRDHVVPLPHSTVQDSIDSLQKDLAFAEADMLQHAAKMKPHRAPARGLSMAVLLLSRSIHETAARIFYSQNRFCFPNTANAWITLEAFLVTIGTTNAQHVQHLSIHAPLWHPGIEHDAVQGALMDSLSPATRLAIIKPPPADRLLAAIFTCVDILTESGALQSLDILLPYPEHVKCWIAKHSVVHRTLVSFSETEAIAERKAQGIAMLRHLSESLGSQNKPTVTIRSAGPIMRNTLTVFRATFLTHIIREADRYGWGVDQRLRESGRRSGMS